MKGHEISGFNLDSHYYVSGLKKEGQCFVNSGGRVILAIGKVQQLKKHKQMHMNMHDK